MKKFVIYALIAAPVMAVRAANPVVFDLEASLRSTPRAATLNDIASEITYIPLETHPDALLGEGNRIAVVDGNVYTDAGNSRSSIYQFDARGKFVRRLTRTGRGPGEYITSLVWHANAARHIIIVADPIGQRLVTVSTDGGQPAGVTMNSADGFGWIPLNDGTFVIHKDIPATRRESPKLSLRFLDANAKILGSVERRGKHAPEAPAINSSYEGHRLWPNYRGEALLSEAWSDTVFTIKSRGEAITPHAVFKRGRLAPTPGDRGTDKRRKIYIGDLYESGDHICLSFQYDGKNYHDIRSKRDSSLLIRRTSGEGAESGLPIRLPDGKIIYSNIAHADRDRLYCVIQAVDACRSLPGVTEDDNPIIVSIKLK